MDITFTARIYDGLMGRGRKRGGKYRFQTLSRIGPHSLILFDWGQLYLSYWDDPREIKWNR